MINRRTFLFLQGVASPLFQMLADRLEESGQRAVRINLCPGDALFWRRPGATDYRGRLDEWPRFLREFLEAHEVSDLVLFSDCRPYHQLALGEARRLGVTTHVFEEGYLRPYWITIDQDATNADSRLPRSAREYLELAALCQRPAREIKFPQGIFNRAAWDVANHAANVFLRFRHPHYLRHRPHHPLRELQGWSRRIIRLFVLGERRRDERALAEFLGRGCPYFLLPLQLESDYQITRHSRFRDLGQLVEEVMSSFAAHAPHDCHLVVKCHPLDNDLINRRRQTAGLAAEAGLADRVLFVDGGHLPTLLKGARGMVTCNSTVGTSAFVHHCPVKALGRAIYDFEGLADQKGLDDFWANPQAADAAVFAAFTTVLRHQCLVNGSFYARAGLEIAAAEGAAKLLGPDRKQLGDSPEPRGPRRSRNRTNRDPSDQP